VSPPPNYIDSSFRTLEEMTYLRYNEGYHFGRTQMKIMTPDVVVAQIAERRLTYIDILCEQIQKYIINYGPRCTVLLSHIEEHPILSSSGHLSLIECLPEAIERFTKAGWSMTVVHKNLGTDHIDVKPSE